MKDHHLHPILDKQLKTAVTEANRGSSKNLLKHLIEFKWLRKSGKIIRLDELNELIDLDIRDSIIVIPEDNAIEQAADIIVSKYKLYIEYLHWNNGGKLDGFVTHKNNIILLNDNYDMRKNICEELDSIYHLEHFKWKNQFIAVLGNSLFKTQYGYFPKSSYNSRVHEILDKFKPRVLYFCDADYFDEDESNEISYKHFDIGKS